MVKCNQRMFWNEDIPIFSKDGVKVRVWAGEFNGVLSLDAPSDSWAFDRSNNVGIWFITISPSSNIDLPVSKKGINRAIYFINGGKPVLNKEEQDPNTYCFVKSGVSINLENIGNSPMEVLVLQGKPIGEPVVQRGPFVMNTEEEIQQAHIDYRKTGFGKWNKYWSDDAVIFARDKGRFVSINGTTEKPPNNF